jgi:hypothetical protein
LGLREFRGLRLAGRKDRTELRFGNGSFAGYVVPGIAIAGWRSIHRSVVSQKE